MTGGERRDLVRLVLAKVEIDLRTGGAEGLIPKPAFLPLFRLEEPVTAGPTILVAGDPEGIRTPDLHRDRVAC